MFLSFSGKLSPNAVLLHCATGVMSLRSYRPYLWHLQTMEEGSKANEYNVMVVYINGPN